MAITRGYTTQYSDQIVLDADFGTLPVTTTTSKLIVSSYVLINVPGDLVYINESVGGSAEPQFIAQAPAGLIPIAATKILSAGVVNGTPRTTLAATVVNATWMADSQY